MDMRRPRPTASNTHSRSDRDTAVCYEDASVTGSPAVESCRLKLLLLTVCVQMSAVGITENVKGDSKKFEVWFNGREEVYIIQV